MTGDGRVVGEAITEPYLVELEDGRWAMRSYAKVIANEEECKINGWEEGTMTECTARAKRTFPYWKVSRA